MRHNKNEEGYALVTVLLIIVVFMVISLSFMGQSFNSVKQNKVVEKNYQSVALAEMGISFYQRAVRNAYLSNQAHVLNQVNQMRVTDRQNKVEKSQEYYDGLVVPLMKQAIQNSLESEQKTLKIEDRDDTFYSIQDVNISSGENGISITFSSLGKQEDEISTLSAEMTIPVNDIGLTDGGESDPSTTYSLPDFNQIKEPAGLAEKCKNPPVIYDSCSEIFIAGSGSFSQNHNQLDDKLLYAKGALLLGGNANNMSNTKIHSDGSMSIGKNMNGAQNVFIEVKGAVSFGGQLRMDYSTVHVGGSMSLDGHLDMENQSFMYVGGSADISKHLSISPDSKMCVAGNLHASQLDIDGELYVKGSINGKIKSGEAEKVNQEDFEKYCGKPDSSQELSVDWEDIVSEIEYSY
jgi:cytoskeletal protein CcmA (bactofilin family)